ncbi:MAG: hypothetical protein R3321_02585 [Nitrososphaeraceae archaeon]|nr:hypothetical protein [Nitrososphaeraceae archaeon]
MQLDVDDILNEKDLMLEVAGIYADMITREIKKLKEKSPEKEPYEEVMKSLVKVFMAFYRNGLTLEKTCINMYGLDPFLMDLLKLHAKHISEKFIEKEVKKRKTEKTDGVF